MSDAILRRALLRVPPEERDYLIQAIKSGATLTRQIPPNVIPLHTAAAAATGQSKPRDGDGVNDLVSRLTANAFFGALPFVRKHFAVAAAFDDVLDHLERLGAEEPEQYAAIRNKGAFLRAMFHDATAEVHDTIVYCRFCDWRRSRLTAHEFDEASG